MHAALLAAVAGLGTSLSLLVAIGAQNAFVLRQGLRREHVAVVVGICSASDAVLITAGISGVGAAVRHWPTAVTVITWVGAAFLACYGVLAARRALRPQRMTAGEDVRVSARVVVLTCLAMTWLNPNVYLDTVLLVGSVATSYGDGRWLFGAGAVTASVLWFHALGFGARLLRRPLARPGSWRVLDAGIAVTMLSLGVLMAARA